MNSGICPCQCVRVTIGVMVMPLAMSVPPLPSETPWRISHEAPVTTMLKKRLSENTEVTSHPPESVTLKSS
jgi:hypothetical protein